MNLNESTVENAALEWFGERATASLRSSPPNSLPLCAKA
jgi:hypothetical protein